MAEEKSAVPLGNTVIPIVNKLHDIFAHLGSHYNIDLPQVAVVGSQSSGKSSVLEALVGRDFLPRGSDICTRRPLLLQLIRRPTKADEAVEEWGEFLHLKGKKFFDFSGIRREIQAETEREAGGNKGVSDKPISLKIFSPNVLDITLVDLPGLTKVPVGDQPSDIETRIRNMITAFIKRESCLILAVTPANADLANSDALQMAQCVDPDGHRTIGVITKLDIMDRGTDACNFLLGKVVPLQLGYVGVVNRSQQDIQLNLSIKDALVAEEKFFCTHTEYSDIADRCGVPQLAKKLNQILVQHIKSVLPGLKSRISAALVSVAKEFASYGEVSESKAGKGALILNVLSNYSEAFISMIEGKNEDISTSELSGGARIQYIFQNIFVKCLEDIDPCEDLTDDDIRTAIQNATGTRSALFVPEVPFEVLVRRQIARLLDPSLQCTRFIYDELIKMSHRCMVNELQQFPVLRKCIDDVTRDFLQESLRPTEAMVESHIETQMDFINTSNPDFIGGRKAIEVASEQVKSRIVGPVAKHKDTGDSEKVSFRQRNFTSRAILGRQANGTVPDHGVRPAADVEKTAESANFVHESMHMSPLKCNSFNAGKIGDIAIATKYKSKVESLTKLVKRVSYAGSGWPITSLFGGRDNHTSPKESSTSKPINEPVQSMEPRMSMIHLREPPSVLRSSEFDSDEKAIEITATKLLLRSYYDIVRKNIQDYVPKAIMHFLVNHTKRELHNEFIKRVYRDNLIEELLREPNEVATKRKRTHDTLKVLEQAFRTIDELPLEVEAAERGYSSTSSSDPTGLPRINGLLRSSLFSNGSTESYSPSSKNSRSRKSGEPHSPIYSDTHYGG
ncbi:dynamin-related protein 3A-like [Salvia hispanica]|uniref:dynamin-related protein 3A-like n=1 Tax=Salvia hispanica TaxID=49212 RepID=UPI002009C749|nr:dynamin-related protein 3A-like [Salvia hispanica]